MKTRTIKEQAFKYYLKGLTFAEIGKLLDISPRTIERYSQDDKWKEKASDSTRLNRVQELYQKGFSYLEIAGKVGISRSTVYNYLKASNSQQET
jgi:uncharacterized protein YjcR